MPRGGGYGVRVDAPVARSRSFVPITGIGRAGAAVALLGLASLVAMIAADRGPDTPSWVPSLWWGWLAITAGGVLTLIALRRGERAVLSFVALVPFALFLILLLMELTGLME